MDVKKEIEGCCTLCYKSFAEDSSLESVIVDEGVLELLTFLISGLDVFALKGSWVCATCLSKVQEAHNFKSSHFGRNLPITSEATEIKEESFLKCHICKNVVEEDTCLSMLELLEENNTKEIILYLIPDSGLQNTENSLVCDMCKNCIIDFREILTLLSVYEKDGQTYSDDSVDEFTDDTNFLKVHIKEENNVVNINSESTISILNGDVAIINEDNNTVKRSSTNQSSFLSSDIKVKEELEDEAIAGCSTEVISDDGEFQPLQCKNEEVDLKIECEEDIQVEGTWRQTEERARAIFSSKVNQNANRHMHTCLLCEYQSEYTTKLIEHQQLIHGMQVSQITSGLKKTSEQPQNNNKRKNTSQIVLNNRKKNFKPNTESDSTKYTILNTHHKIYKCQYCQFSCRQENELMQHIKSHYTFEKEKDVFKCSCCSFQTKFHSNLTIHMLLHAKPESLDTLNSKQSEVQNDDGKNYEIPQYLCQFCDFSCHVQSAFFEHFNSHRDGHNIFKCNLCTFQTKYKSTLIVHKFTHEADDRPGSFKEAMKIYKCEMCDFETKYEHELRNHLQKHRKEVNNVMYQCKVCGYQTYYKRTFDNHLQRHDVNHCAVCGFSCIGMTNFHEHMKKHDTAEPHGKTEQHDKVDETILRCDSCGFQTKFKSNFTIHMLLHTSVNGEDEENEMIDEQLQFDKNSDEYSFKCDSCPFRTKFENQLKMHKSFKHRNYEDAKITQDVSSANDPKNPTYNCWYCSFKTEQVAKFSEHLDSHYQCFKCNRCDFEADSKTALNNHLWDHYKIHQCKLCSFKCVNKDELDNHVESHATHKCPICSFACTQDELDGHLKSCESAKNPEKFICVACPFKTASQVEYMDHLVLHNKEEFFQCHWCDYKTGSRRNFHRHICKHTRTFYRCPTCKYQTYNKENFDKHMQSHKKYDCEICNYTCYKDTDLKKHLEVHDEQSENILKCDRCDFQTKFKSNLTIHKLLHKKPFEGKTLKCTLCNYETKMETFMKQHLRKHKYPSFNCQQCNFKTTFQPLLTKHLTEIHKEVQFTIKTETIDIT